MIDQSNIKELLAFLASGKHLTVQQASEAFEAIMSGTLTNAQVAALLAMMQVRGPSVDELTGAAAVMRRKVRTVLVPSGLRVIDTCGTGGDHSGTFNISTAAAIVAASASRPSNVAVAKHGNRSVTSKSGSSQVLEALKVKINVSDATLTQCLDKAGLCFCFAPAHHPAMKHVAMIRQELGMRTVFNQLGPLTNPAGATAQVIGVFSAALTEPIARVLKNLGTEHAMVVHGLGMGQPGMDELITHGPSQISHLTKGEVTTYRLEPEKLGFKPVKTDDLLVDGPEQSAATIQRILAGKKGQPRDIVCLNAAAALVVADLVLDLHEGLMAAAEAIDSGRAAATLKRLIDISNADPT